MKLEINPQDLDQVGDIEQVTRTDETDGETTESWAALFSSVRFRWMDPLMSSAKEAVEGSKSVAKQKRTALMRKEDRSTILPKNCRLKVSTTYWYIETVRPYKGSRNLLAVDVWNDDKDETNP